MKRGSYFFNVICSLLTERNSFQTDANKLVRLQNEYAMGSSGSYSREGVIFSLSVPRGGGGVNERGSYCPARP